MIERDKKMKDVETILANLVRRNEAYDTLTKAYDLLKDYKSEEAKALIDSVIKANNNEHNPSNILYRILAMVHNLNESNYSFNDIIEYHSEYRSIINISCFGNEWIYGDNINEITEVSEAVVSMASDMLPDSYGDLLMGTSKFDEAEMYDVHEDIEYSLIEPVSKMMRTIEQINAYNMHALLDMDKSVKSILDACDKLDE